ncbi:MAG TPA: MaoC family dehydratase N-terminal domain-containing protein [Dehalococcoidia bacterium]|nr:MaoC family dehydratase N-terminal domain-containing protein [Dehalococcoidia bacterium]
MTGEKRPTFEEVKAMVGKKKEEVLEIDKSVIRNFAQCIGDSNSKWKDTAPPGLLTTVIVSGSVIALKIPQPYKRGVAAGADWEFYKPIKLGDVITTVHEFADIQDKSTEKGKRALIIFKSKHTNQKGELVAISTNSVISME